MKNTDFLHNYGPWAVVTGASSGIGAEFCRQLAAMGLNIVMVSRRRERMETLAQEITKRHPIHIIIIPADLAQEDFLSFLEPEIEGLEIGLLVNNAGFGIGGGFLDHDINRELEQLNVNCRAPLLLTHRLAPEMIKRRRGGIIFLSSALGYIPTPLFANYAATKAHNLFIGEALYYELKPYNVAVLTLSPGLTATEFGTIAGTNSRMPKMSPGTVVKTALHSLGKKPAVIPGIHNKFFVQLTRFLPRNLLEWILSRSMKSRIRQK